VRCWIPSKPLPRAVYRYDEQWQLATRWLRRHCADAAGPEPLVERLGVGVRSDGERRTAERADGVDGVLKQLPPDTPPHVRRIDPHVLELEGSLCARERVEPEDLRTCRSAVHGMSPNELGCQREVVPPELDQRIRVAQMALGSVRDPSQIVRVIRC